MAATIRKGPYKITYMDRYSREKLQERATFADALKVYRRFIRANCLDPRIHKVDSSGIRRVLVSLTDDLPYRPRRRY